MKQAYLDNAQGAPQLEIRDCDVQKPSHGEILVRIEASSLNFHDYAVVKGIIPTPSGRVPLSDCAGVVEAIGEDVEELRVGDRVVSRFFPHWDDGGPTLDRLRGVPGDHTDGFAAGYATMPASAFDLAPRNLTAREAATLPCAALTAWRALMVEYHLKPGDWVVVQGSGGVSLFALQFAKMAGANVAATSSSDRKLERLRELGADVLINYRDVPNWGDAVVREIGRGADIVVEIGGPGTLPQSIAASRIGGTIVLIGVLTGFSGEIPTGLMMSKNITLSAVTVGSRMQQHAMIAAIEAGNIKPVISHALPLEKIGDAFAIMERGEHFGKIVLEHTRA
jgi:NADPH:quinone reductase-like Zn-dependent oxidoreductase